MKKKIAVALTAVMMLGNGFGVFAESLGDLKEGAVEINAVSAISAIDEDVYRVVLPTAGAMDFVVDPQGLTQITESGKLEDTTKGLIAAKGEAIILNKSSKDLKITTNFAVTANDTALTATTSDCNDGSDNNVLLAAVPVKGDYAVDATSTATHEVYDAAEVKGGSGGGGIDDTTYKVEVSEASSTGIVLATATTDIVAVLPAAEYEVKATASEDTPGKTDYSYELASDAVLGSVGFQLAGYCNPNADWLDFVGDTPAKDLPTVTATFKFDEPTEAEAKVLDASDSTNYNAFGITDLNNSTKVVEIVGATGGSSAVDGEATTTNATYIKNIAKTTGAVLFTLKLEDGTTFTATDVESIKVGSETLSKGTATTADTCYVAAGKVGIAKGSTCFSGLSGEVKITIKAIDKDGETKTFAYTANIA